MNEEEQRHALGPPPPIAKLIPELDDEALMASFAQRGTNRKPIDAIVNRYDKRYSTHQRDFLKQRGKETLPKPAEVKAFHRQWREYVRRHVDPCFHRVRRAVAIHEFVEQQEKILGCELVSGVRAGKIVPMLDLKAIAKKGRLRRAVFDRSAPFYAKEDLERIAVEDAAKIEKKRRDHEERVRQRLIKRNTRPLRELLGRGLMREGVRDMEVVQRIYAGVMEFESVQQAIADNYFCSSWDPTLPDDALSYVIEELCRLAPRDTSSDEQQQLY